MRDGAVARSRAWTSAKKVLAKAAWRIPAAVGWLWFLSSMLLTPTLLRPLQVIETGHYLLLVMTSAVLYVGVQEKRTAGCGLFLIGFPLYLVSFPIIVVGLFVSNLLGAVVTGARRSQEMKTSVLPYLVTTMVLVWLFRTPSALSAVVLSPVVAANILFVLLSLAVWIFAPLRWLSGAIEWGLAYIQKNFQESLPVEPEDLTRHGRLVERIQDSVAKAKRGHEHLVRFRLIDLGEVQDSYQDLIVTVGFLRKFFFTLGHIILLFAILQYAATIVSESEGFANQPTPQGFAEVWPVHVYDAAMTLVGNGPDVAPVSGLSRAVAVTNVYSGVVLLVLLVTTFSMLTRERVKSGMQDLVERIEAAAMTLEWHFLAAAAQATQTGTMDPQLLNKLKDVERFAILPDERVEAFHGILAMNDMYFQTYLGPDVDSARLLARARSAFEISDYERLMFQLREFGSEVQLDQFIVAVKNVLEGPAGLFDDERGDLGEPGDEEAPALPEIRLQLPVHRLTPNRATATPQITLRPPTLDDVEREQQWANAYNTGTSALKRGDVERALGQFREADRLYQKRPEAKIALGSLYVKQGETRAAAEAYLGALEILSGPVPEQLDEEAKAEWADSRRVVALNASELLARIGDYEQAAETLQGFLGAHEADLDAETAQRARAALAGVLVQAGDAEAAEVLYEEILNRPDVTANEYFQAGIGFFNMENYARAAEAFEAAAELNPYSRDALLNSVQALYSQAMKIEETEETPERNKQLRTIHEQILEAATEVRELDPLNRNVVSFMLRSYRGLADLAKGARAQRFVQQTQDLFREYQTQTFEVSDIQIAMEGDEQARITASLGNLNAEAGQQVKLQFELLNDQGQVIDDRTVPVKTPERGSATQFSIVLDIPVGEFAGWRYFVA